MNSNSTPSHLAKDGIHLNNLVQDKIDILVVTESKLDDMFPDSQFHIPRYNVPFRKDRNKLGGGSYSLCKG